MGPTILSTEWSDGDDSEDENDLAKDMWNSDDDDGDSLAGDSSGDEEVLRDCWRQD